MFRGRRALEGGGTVWKSGEPPRGAVVERSSRVTGRAVQFPIAQRPLWKSARPRGGAPAGHPYRRSGISIAPTRRFGAAWRSPAPPARPCARASVHATQSRRHAALACVETDASRASWIPTLAFALLILPHPATCSPHSAASALPTTCLYHGCALGYARNNSGASNSGLPLIDGALCSVPSSSRCLCRAGAPTHGGAWRRQPPLAAAAAGTRRRRWRRLRRDDGGGSRRRQLRAGAVACGERRARSERARQR